jgi:hypothetical protein
MQAGGPFTPCKPLTRDSGRTSRNWLITDWVRATDDIKRKQLANEVQTVALDK